MALQIETPDKIVISYDPQARSAYIRVRGGRSSKTLEEIPDSLMVDVDSKGRLLGVELLFPSRITLRFRLALGRIADRFRVPALKHLRPLRCRRCMSA